MFQRCHKQNRQICVLYSRFYTYSCQRMNENFVFFQSPSNNLQQMKRDLEGWREVLLPLNGLLHWEKPYYPAIIVGVNTFIFA